MFSKVSSWAGLSSSLSFAVGLGDDWLDGLEGMESRIWSSEDDFNNGLGGGTAAPSNLSYVSCGISWGGSAGGSFLLKIYWNRV